MGTSPAFTGGGVRGFPAIPTPEVGAVGGWAGGGKTSLHGDGSSWSQIPTAFLRFGGVGAVTALSPANVWAVGTGPGVPTGGLSAHPPAGIEHWDDTTWSRVPRPNPHPQGNHSPGAAPALSAKHISA